MKKIEDYFNEEAVKHDELFVQKIAKKKVVSISLIYFL